MGGKSDGRWQRRGNGLVQHAAPLPINFWLRDMDAIAQLLTVFVLSFVAAELSYRLVESRFTAKRRSPEASEQQLPVPSVAARAA